MKRFALIVAVIVLLAPQTFAGTWNKSYADAMKKAKSANQLVFVDLFADWCGWCHRMEQEVFPSEIFQKATDKMVLLRLNTEDGGDGTKFAQKFNVTSLPTFLILTPEDNVAGILRGYAPAKEFVTEMQNTQARYHDFEKRAANEETYGSDYKKRFDLAVEYTQHFAFPQAESRFKKLISDSKAPTDIRDRAYYELAITQVFQNHFGEATSTLNAFSKVETKGEPYERSRLLQAQMYWQQGNLMAAANELRQFKVHFPASPMKDQADQMLQVVQQGLQKK
ncbi:MAG TPA: thioredoxin family protein [Thermoanaerobaculia bacterium]|nr:thioredoxin family protein [Thermoanaerobaculia bacterium]